MKAKLASILGGGSKKKSNSKKNSKNGGSEGGYKRSDRSDSDIIDRKADLKVSNPHFVGEFKLANRSFIRYVKAESQSHQKASFLNAPVPNELVRHRNSDYSSRPVKGLNQLITLRKLSGESDDAANPGSFLR